MLSLATSVLIKSFQHKIDVILLCKLPSLSLILSSSCMSCCCVSVCDIFYLFVVVFPLSLFNFTVFRICVPFIIPSHWITTALCNVNDLRDDDGSRCCSHTHCFRSIMFCIGKQAKYTTNFTSLEPFSQVSIICSTFSGINYIDTHHVYIQPIEYCELVNATTQKNKNIYGYTSQEFLNECNMVNWNRARERLLTCSSILFLL